MMDEGSMDDVEVLDRDRVIKFRGRLLGGASTRGADRERWTTVDIYRTEAGTYIIQIVGRTRIAGENDRHTAHIATAAAGAVESLHQVDEDGVRFITRVARLAAERAAQHDEEFSRAFYAEHVA